ncbi:hypothetical protein [Acinetobacter ursingii]|uniref:Uncharacterized protein n=1 Tax=Acinetobacter ursingii TaxID=108980 RepID=A0AA46S4P4_9GAMM|nr:hypothetical protein [Acinetobacter ursingii]UYF73034.1 hypothetical protein LSO60_07220 [Acinetobacter ursingii]
MIYPSLSAGLAQLQALATFIDKGSNNATFIFYDSNKPANTSTAADNAAKLVTLNLPDPCIKSVESDHIELHPSDSGTVIKTGTAKWARLFNGEGSVVADFVVGTDISLANTNLVVGGTLNITSIKLYPNIGS